MGINQNKAFLNGSYRLSVCSICHSLTVSSVLLYHSITCVWMWDAVVPFVASMPPTANMAPTVALRGRVRGLWSRGRRWGKRWYFIPSIRRRWHSTLSRRRGLLSRSARNYRHMQKRNEKKKAKASTRRIMWQLQLEYMEGTRMCYISMGVGTCWLRCYRWLKRFKSRKKAALSHWEIRWDQTNNH